jgi:isopentenyldiphosphate isomerase
MTRKELIEIVDKNGNSTGEILEKELAHDRNLLHKEVGLFIINSNNQVLLQKRSANKRIKPNIWGLCAGHVDAYEDNLVAMHRELKEELGFDANKNDIIPFDIVLKENESNSHIGYRYYMFLDRDVKDFIIQEEELSEVKWIDFIEFKNMVINNNPNITFSNNKDNINTINKLEEIIRKHNK